jgi:hypothetical protein
MTLIIDDIDTHMAGAGAIERAALVPGMYLAWCVNLQLVSTDFAREFERETLRLRYRDLSPGAFFVKVTGGRLSEDQLSERGRLFAEHYYAIYRGETVRWLYASNDDWDTYDAIARGLTKAYYAFADDGHKVARPGGKHWWKVWR